MAETLETRYSRGLERFGWKIDLNARTGKYRVYKHKAKDFYFYVGRSGALRAGKTVATSCAIGPRTKATILAKADENRSLEAFLAA